MKTTSALFSALALLTLTACGNDFTPREKTAQFDPETGTLDLPYPCPDWSHSAVINYDNSSHSNYGCAVNTNIAQQLANPEDLAHGRSGDATQGADTEGAVRVIEQYRSGAIPAPLVPVQGAAAGGE